MHPAKAPHCRTPDEDSVAGWREFGLEVVNSIRELDQRLAELNVESE